MAEIRVKENTEMLRRIANIGSSNESGEAKRDEMKLEILKDISKSLAEIADQQSEIVNQLYSISVS